MFTQLGLEIGVGGERIAEPVDGVARGGAEILGVDGEGDFFRGAGRLAGAAVASSPSSFFAALDSSITV